MEYLSSNRACYETFIFCWVEIDLNYYDLLDGTVLRAMIFNQAFWSFLSGFSSLSWSWSSSFSVEAGFSILKNFQSIDREFNTFYCKYSTINNLHKF